MGIVKVKFKVYNPAGMSKYAEIDGIVDTGVVYSVISASLLNSLGIRPLERRRFLASVAMLSVILAVQSSRLWVGGARNCDLR